MASSDVIPARGSELHREAERVGQGNWARAARKICGSAPPGLKGCRKHEAFRSALVQDGRYHDIGSNRRTEAAERPAKDWTGAQEQDLRLTPEREIWQAASLMINRHGPDAAMQAALRADELLDAGDLDGAATWRAIIRAIDQLLRDRPTAGVH
jgi:hypothetical protein